MTIAGQLSIGIASKNRPDALNRTLRKIHEFGVNDCPILIFDDGSTPPVKCSALELFRNGSVIRVDRSVGQALGRNRICEVATTPYILQLDDDSYPITGDIQALLDMASNTVDWLAVAIPFEEPGRSRWPAGVPADHLIPVRSFVGCSALLNVKNFRSLGGYASWIGRTCEEDELAMRGWKAGYKIFIINLLRTRHDVTDVGRSLSGIAYRSFRNWFLTWALHAPAPIVPIKAFRLLGASFLHSAKHRDLAACKGVKDAIKSLPSLASYREPLTISQYRRWKSMPHALDLFSQVEGQLNVPRTVESIE